MVADLWVMWQAVVLQLSFVEQYRALIVYHGDGQVFSHLKVGTRIRPPTHTTALVLSEAGRQAGVGERQAYCNVFRLSHHLCTTRQAMYSVCICLDHFNLPLHSRGVIEEKASQFTIDAPV